MIEPKKEFEKFLADNPDSTIEERYRFCFDLGRRYQREQNEAMQPMLEEFNKWSKSKDKESPTDDEIIKSLKKNKGNRTKTYESFEISKSKFYRRLRFIEDTRPDDLV